MDTYATTMYMSYTTIQLLSLSTTRVYYPIKSYLTSRSFQLQGLAG